MKVTAAGLVGVLFIAMGGRAVAANDPPGILAVANSSGLITVNYQHSGFDTVWYDIYRDDLPVYRMYSPSGQYLDTNLPPDTAFVYRVCAVYEDGDEECSPDVVARTQPKQGPSSKLAPPEILGATATENTVTMFWGTTGAYNKLIVGIKDDLGNWGQEDVTPVPNGSYTFVGLRPGTRYYVMIEACNRGVGLPSTCGGWSAPVVVVTATPTPPPPPPPSRPELRIISATEASLILGYYVRVPAPHQEKMVLYRDGVRLTELPRKPADGGWTGSFTDKPAAKHVYKVCIEGSAPPVNLCSENVVDPVWRVTAKESLEPRDPAAAVSALVPKPLKKLDKNIRSCGDTVAGVWNSRTELNAAFRLVLEQRGSNVAGSFIHQDPTYNGTLTGSINGNTLAFTTAQPNHGAGGGEFVLSASGCQMHGRFWSNADPGTVYSWMAWRAQ